jgi:hypothetical protein
MRTETSIKINETRLGEEILICLEKCGLKLVRADGKDFPVGYSPTLALGQALGPRLTYPVPVVYIHTSERYDPDEECPSA